MCAAFMASGLLHGSGLRSILKDSLPSRSILNQRFSFNSEWAWCDDRRMVLNELESIILIIIMTMCENSRIFFAPCPIPDEFHHLTTTSIM